IRGQRSAAGPSGARRKFASHPASPEPPDIVNPATPQVRACYGVPPTSSSTHRRRGEPMRYPPRSKMDLRPGLRAVRFIGLALFLLAMLANAFSAGAQTSSKVFRGGHLAAGGRTSDGAPPGPLREALRGLGYLEGQNIAYEARFAEGAVERLPGLAAELVE